MSPKFAALAGSLALLLLAGAAGAQPAPQPQAGGAALSELIGLDPAGVRARLANVPADWPVPPAFQIATPQGRLAFATTRELMMDPVEAQSRARMRTQGDLVASGPYVACQESLVRNGRPAEQGGSVVLTFRDGRLASAFLPVEPAMPPPPNYSDRKAQLAYLRRPRSSPFIAQLGQLPLEDGPGFLSRTPKDDLAAADRLSAACAPPSPPPAPPHRADGHRALDASDMQGLALLPFAITLPAKNRQRVEARAQGAAVLAALRLGEPLGAPPERFAAAHPGVRAYPAKAPDYAVLSIDLGGYPGRNLSNFNDSALVGVRGGRIEWIAPPAEFGPGGGLLCLDDHGVPAAPRRGCSGWGHFSP